MVAEPIVFATPDVRNGVVSFWLSSCRTVIWTLDYEWRSPISADYIPLNIMLLVWSAKGTCRDLLE